MPDGTMLRHWSFSSRRDNAMSRRARHRPLSSLGLMSSLAIAAALLWPPAPVFGRTQDDITALALSTFNTASATFDWNTYLNQYLNGVPASGIAQYEAGQLAWGESYAAMAERAMFDATGDTQYLDLLLHGAETMYANRADRLAPPLIDEVRNTLMPAFISFRYNLGTQHAWMVHSAFPSHPVTYAISKINSDPQLQSTYGARADALATDIIETMDSFDPDFSLISGGRGVYYEPYLDLTSAISDGQTPYNMQDAAGSTYVGLWKATGEQRFYDRAVALANTLKNEFTPVGDRYQWRYAPYNPSNSASDISHAGLDVNFVVDAYEAGIVFDDTDIQRLANTMRHMQVGPGFTANVDGVGAGSVSKTSVAWLWLRLTRYDSALREEMYPIFQNYWNTTNPEPLPIFPTLGSALLYETGQPYTTQEQFNDSFAGSQINARWRRPPDQPIGNTWKAQASNSQFVVSDIDTTSSGNQWVDIVRTRDVDQDDSWEVAFDFSWDSTETGADPLQAMQRFSIELRDSLGNLIANVGINDAWNQNHGGRVFQLYDELIVEPANSLDLAGTASVTITSDALLGISQVLWNEQLVLSAPQTADLQQLALSFGNFGGTALPSHFGTISVGNVAVAEVPLLAGDYNRDGFINAADYNNWRATFGQSATPGSGTDGNGNGTIDAADYAVWRDKLGNGDDAASVAVPEPSAWIMTSWVLIGYAGWTRIGRDSRAFLLRCFAA